MSVNLLPPTSEHLDITVIDHYHTKNLIRQNQYCSSIVLRLNRPFEWPENIVFVNLKKLEIHTSKDYRDQLYFSLFSTMWPLRGNLPNLEQITIKTEVKAQVANSLQHLSYLLKSVPHLKKLILDFRTNPVVLYNNNIRSSRIRNDFLREIPTWHLPKLESLVIEYGLNYEFLPSFKSILHNFATSFPKLESFTSHLIREIDDQGMEALSQLQSLKELHLPRITKFTTLIKKIPNIATLEISKPSAYGEESKGWPWCGPGQILQEPVHLRELCLHDSQASKASNNINGLYTSEAIDLLTYVPSLEIMEIAKLQIKGQTKEEPNFRMFVEFLKAFPTAFGQREVTIQLREKMKIITSLQEDWRSMKVVLNEVGWKHGYTGWKETGGVVETGIDKSEEFDEFEKKVMYVELIRYVGDKRMNA